MKARRHCIVKGTVPSGTTSNIGNYFEWTSSTTTVKKYYYTGSIKVAMRTESTLRFLLGDHLGGMSISTNSNGVFDAELRYMPWGTTRYTSGSSPTTIPSVPSGKAPHSSGQVQYTGQRLESTLGLLFYNARWSPGRAPSTGDPAARTVRWIESRLQISGASLHISAIHGIARNR